MKNNNTSNMEWSVLKEGKVREIYEKGDEILILTTDRISAFDKILKNQIPDKGKVLTQMSRFWFEFTKDLLKNHVITYDPQDLPEKFRDEFKDKKLDNKKSTANGTAMSNGIRPEYEGRLMLCQKLRMLPVECIVRGYITGSGWDNYKKDGTICGIKLPSGLKECAKLPSPLYTPSTKADIGEHDENISFEKTIPHLEKAFPGKGRALAEKIMDLSLKIYEKCAEYALEKGIIIADTKLEFGLDQDGEVILADELLTPDSSRFWRLSDYTPGQSQKSFDKQYVRDYLKAHPDNDGFLPDEVVEKTSILYKEAYNMLSSESLL